MNPVITINTKLAGVTMEPARQARLQRIHELVAKGYKLEEFKVRIIHESDNEHDPNACRVDVYRKSEDQWVDLGFIPRQAAAIVAPCIDNELIVSVKLKDVTFFLDEKKGKIFYCFISIQPKRG